MEGEIKTTPMKGFICSLAISCSLISCNAVTGLNYQDYTHLSENKQEVDMSKYVYYVDSIPYDSDHFVILSQQQKQWHFYVHEAFLTKNKKIKDNCLCAGKYSIMEFSTIYAFGEEYGFARFEESSSKPSDCFYTISELNDGWSVLSFKSKPSYLRLYLIRGDFLTFMRQAVFDGDGWIYNMNNKESYYKVVVPVWK